MRLTRFSDIGLRALMYLGAHRSRTVPASEMARRLNVSRDHLMKSLQALDGLGCVESTRGRSGGFRLSEGAARMRLGGIVRSLEPTLALAECFEPGSSCPLTSGCRLAGILVDAQNAFFDTLDAHTLADLVAADGPRLVQLSTSHD